MANRGWSRWHHRFHRHLLEQPALLPAQARLLVAVSGGQDSMALLRLLLDLHHLHHWTLHIWHGDHGWHGGSGTIVSDLAAWCQTQGQTLIIDRAGDDEANTETMARDWRAKTLLAHCQALGCDAVTGHTASDRAETVLINLARGSDLSGLGSLNGLRPLESNQPEGPQLRRPLLLFSRSDTAAGCQELGLPIWLDPSNASLAHARNRIRHQVLPVLEELHPGCSQRMANTAGRMADQRHSRQELTDLALEQLRAGKGLDRRAVERLSSATRQVVLARWLEMNGVPMLKAEVLAQVARRLGHGRPGGSATLRDGWTLGWKAGTITLSQADGSR